MSLPEHIFTGALIHGLFYGLYVVLFLHHLIRAFWSRSWLHVQYALINLGSAAFLFVLDLQTIPELHAVIGLSGYRYLIFLAAFTGFCVLMVLKILSNAFNHNGATDVYLAFAFGVTVFSTVVGPFLDADRASMMAVVVLLATGLFVSLFSLFVLREESGRNLFKVSGLVMVLIAMVLGLFQVLDVSLPAFFQVFGIHVTAAAGQLLIRFLSLESEFGGEGANPNESAPAYKALLEEKKRMEEYVAMTAHEIRTPLNGIIGLSDILLEGMEGDLSEGQTKHLGLISQSGRRLSYLLSDLLDAERIRAGHLELEESPIHVRSLVNRVLAIAAPNAAGKGLELKNNVPAELANIRADANKLEQVLMNLVSNSVKYTETGHVSVSAEIRDGQVEIRVEDTGKGLSKRNLDQLMGASDDRMVPNSSTRHSSGLGLKIIYRLLEAHGSKLVAVSEPDYGSSFSFTMPITTELAPVDLSLEEFTVGVPRPASGATGAPRLRRLTPRTDQTHIMIVDDEAINLKVLNAQLTRTGYRVTECYSGAEALRQLEAGTIPDLMVLDIMMPNMSGLEVLDRIREKYVASELPVILLTAKNHTADILEGFQRGANDYATKPVAKDELLARIRTHVELARVYHAFSRFVPHEFLQFLGYNSMLDIRLGDQVQKNMTVLFSDIKDFTRLSEALSPKEAFDFINTFLGVVSPVIREHGGFVDKFIGDAIMALFPGPADNAVAAAVRMMDALKSLNIDRELKGLEPIRVGTGLHTGELMLGTIGEEMRMEGTVISDVVNTASRMEGLTKLFDNTVVISSATRDALQDKHAFHFKYLGKSKVKGKQILVDVFGVIEGDEDKQVALELETRPEFEKGIREFYNRNFTTASVHFNEVLKKNPNDKAAALFLKNSADLMVRGVPTDWDGAVE